jgi:hypothetical protein
MKVERLEPTHPLAKMRLLAVLTVWAGRCYYRPALALSSARLQASSPNSSPVAYFNMLFSCSTAVLAASWVSN